MDNNGISELSALDGRVSKIEGMIVEMNSTIGAAIAAQTGAMERHADTFERLATQIATAIGFQGKILEIQSQSLSLPLLKDVLLPITFKIFGFFAMLVVALIGSILGIKWLFGNVLG